MTWVLIEVSSNARAMNIESMIGSTGKINSCDLSDLS